MDTTKNKNTEAFKVIGNWDAQSKELRQKYSQLTDSDVKFETGKEEELLTRLGTRLSKKREEVIDILRQEQPEKV